MWVDRSGLYKRISSKKTMTDLRRVMAKYGVHSGLEYGRRHYEESCILKAILWMSWG